MADRIKCVTELCATDAVFLCSCGSELFFCKNHISEHLLEGQGHIPKPLYMNCSEDERWAAKETLELLRKLLSERANLKIGEINGRVMKLMAEIEELNREAVEVIGQIWDKYHEVLDTLNLVYEGKGLPVIQKSSFSKRLEEIKQGVGELNSDFMVSLLAEYEFDSEKIVEALFNVGCFYMQRKEWGNALLYHNRSMEMKKIVYKDARYPMATSLFKLGEIAEAQNDIETAHETYKKLLKVIEGTILSNGIEEAFVLQKIGNILISKRDFDAAFEYIHNALDVYNSRLPVESPEVADCEYSLGSIYYRLGDIDRGLMIFSAVLRVRKGLFDDDDPAILKTRMSLGKCYLEQKRYSKALKQFSIVNDFLGINLECRNYLAIVNRRENNYKRARKLYDQILEELDNDWEKIGEIYNNRAVVFRKQGLLDKARLLYTKALKYLDKTQNKYHICMYNIGILHYKLGNINEALNLCNNVHQYMMSIANPRSLDLAFIVGKIGFLHWKKHDLENSLKYYAEAATLQPSESLKSTSFNNCGVIESLLHNYDNAQYLLKQALSIKERYDQDELGLAFTLSTYGHVLLALKDPEKALPLIQRALELKKTHLSSNDPSIAFSLTKLSEAQRNSGDLDLSIITGKSALELLYTHSPSQDIHISECLTNIGVSYGHKKQLNKSLEYFKSSLYIQKQLFRTGHVYLATSYNNIGTVWLNKGSPQNAIKYYEKSLKMRQKLLPGDHDTIANSFMNIGSAYYTLLNFKESLKNYTQSLEMRKRLFGDTHEDIADLYDRIGALYIENKNVEKGLEFYQSSLKMREMLYPPGHTAILGSQLLLDSTKLLI